MWWDEQRQRGRVSGLAFLLHPGPSILVTATFVAIAGLAMHGVPPPGLALRLVLLMLPMQFAIGVINDVADLPADRTGKAYKPLVRGVVQPRTAAWVGAVLAMLGLAAAATISLPVLGLTAGGLGAGLAYDLGLRRTALSLLPWWAGMSILPLAAYAAAGRLTPRLLLLLPVSLLAALALHCANAVPDIDADRAAGRRSLPVRLGVRGSRWAGVAALAAAGVMALVLQHPLGQSGPWVVVAAVLLAAALLGVAALRVQRPFPVMAVTTALFAVSWLGTLPLD